MRSPNRLLDPADDVTPLAGGEALERVHRVVLAEGLREIGRRGLRFGMLVDAEHDLHEISASEARLTAYARVELQSMAPSTDGHEARAELDRAVDRRDDDGHRTAATDAATHAARDRDPVERGPLSLAQRRGERERLARSAAHGPIFGEGPSSVNARRSGPTGCPSSSTARPAGAPSSADPAISKLCEGGDLNPYANYGASTSS